MTAILSYYGKIYFEADRTRRVTYLFSNFNESGDDALLIECLGESAVFPSIVSGRECGVRFLCSVHRLFVYPVSSQS